MYRLVYLFSASDIIIYATTVIIIRRIINAWSWNEISCSIIGDALSCKFIFAHVVISKKSYYLYMWSLNPPHLSAKLDIN
jgi:hypothetical protein